MAESPDISPDGKMAGVRRPAQRHRATSSRSTSRPATSRTSPTTRSATTRPTWAPDGKSIVYLARVSGNDKLFRLDLATGKKTQLTFGTHDDGGAQFMDADTLVFPSTAVDPNQPISPEVARNGNIYNVWTLNLKTNELKQFTDALGGNVSPVVLRDENKAQRIAFVTYYKGEYGIHTVPAQKEALHTVATADFGAPGPIIDFQPPLSHTLVKEQPAGQGTLREAVPRGTAAGQRRRHQRRRLLRRHAGDLHRRARRPAVQLLRRVGLAVPLVVGVVPEPVAAVPVRAAGLLADAVLLRERRRDVLRGAVRLPEPRRRAVDADLARRHDLRDLPAEPLRAPRGDRRPDASSSRSTTTRTCSRRPSSTSIEIYGRVALRGRQPACRSAPPTSARRPCSASTARSRATRCALGYEYAPKIGGFISRQTFDVDARKYIRLATNGVLAFRFRGLKSWGDYPNYLYSGGNSELRGYEYLEFIGNKAFFANAELRFPLIEAALTPIGVIGGLRAVAFANLGASQFAQNDMQVYTKDADHRAAGHRLSAGLLHRRDHAGLGPPQTITGLRLRRRPRLLRHRPRDLRARLPDPLRLVVADAAQQGLGRLRLLLPGDRRRRDQRQQAGCASRSSRFGSATISRRS